MPVTLLLINKIEKKFYISIIYIVGVDGTLELPKISLHCFNSLNSFISFSCKNI